MAKKIFSGVQPTGNLHLGNYLGAIKNFVKLGNDKENDCIFCVVDLHAITLKQNPKELRNNIRETVATFVASGKDKEKASVGLYSYPVLMAADILLYDSTHVPVGDDQKQHLELCRDIAQKFNNDFEADNFFITPEPLIQKEFSRIMSLKDGTKKMSKSDVSDLSRINLTDTEDQIINKIKKAKTDTLPMPSNLNELDERHEVRNLIGIYSSLTDSSLEKSLKYFSGKNFSNFKESLSQVLVDKICPISNEIKKLLSERSFLDNILDDGCERADKIASKKVKKIHEIIGF